MGLSMGLSSWWQSLVRRRAPQPTHLQLVMYTRSGCHLCESAWIELLEAQKRHGFALSAVDVDDDPELAARFGDDVPVITLNGKVRFRGRLNRALLTRLIRAEERRH
jgi:glutaredoxin